MKRIEQVSDLAINGAPPAFSEPLHIGRPRVGDKSTFLDYVDRIYETRWLTNNGPLVQELESRIASLHDAENCVVMCNGTIALEIAIRALELSGEVIVPAYTFVATAHALSWQGLTPVFADIDADTHCISAESAESCLTERTSGIIGVHLWGRVAAVEELEDLAKANGLKLLFDAAHAFGGSYQGTSIGSFGECEVLSFHATKYFNSFEGGAVLTQNRELAEKMRLMRNFGFADIDRVVQCGTNGKMTEICAAMGLTNLDGLDAVRAHNLEVYKMYSELFGRHPKLKLLLFDENESNNYQYIVLQLADEVSHKRDVLVEALRAENVLARKYFWPGCHNMAPYCDSENYETVDLAVTDSVAASTFVLPNSDIVDREVVEGIAKIIDVVLEEGV